MTITFLFVVLSIINWKSSDAFLLTLLPNYKRLLIINNKISRCHRLHSTIAEPCQHQASENTYDIEHSQKNKVDANCCQRNMTIDDEEHVRTLVLPPPFLQDLENVGDSFQVPGTPVEIMRAAIQPDIFVMRNFLPWMEDREELIDFIQTQGLESAKTKYDHDTHRKATSPSTHRTKSNVGWIGGTGDNDDCDDENNGNKYHETAAFMTQFVTQILIHPDHHPSLFQHDYDNDSTMMVRAEDLQVVHYETGGKFDIHHDGGGRICTVLTYLNGVAGTWFPFATTTIGLSEEDSNDELPPDLTFGPEMTVAKTPGKDGIWVVGTEDEENGENNHHTVHIQAGDALVFYNYEYNKEYRRPIMSWRGLHMGMAAKQEKWIATNWIESQQLLQN